ncbi:FGGY family carbohydrate kinase [Saprospiraceae bacterium]|nr:FGGY family carbohydrate kinase [Saprospiraceae bacterium]
MYLLGLDLGSSSVKASIVDSRSGRSIALVQYPDNEMNIISKERNWAEQDPAEWWKNVKLAIKLAISKAGISNVGIQAIGISYQMHGLVLIDNDHEVLRPSIIWCDSRAIDIGEKAFVTLGSSFCLENYLNSPGNFTASKLKWVKDNEPDIYKKAKYAMLPGDYINLCLTGEINTTISGLSEGVFWNFKEDKLATKLFDLYELDVALIPEIVDSSAIQGKIKPKVAEELGLSDNVFVTYRAGDQPNNAMSLGVLEAGEVAATGGTSGVIYGVSDKKIWDSKSRINSFAHVNHNVQSDSIGILLCINGAGSLYAWLRKQITGSDLTYKDIEKMIQIVPIGSDELRILPFGNGSERMLNNSNNGAQVNNLLFNKHTAAHLFRAGLEGIAFSFVYGFDLLKELGFAPKKIKVGNDNLFQSDVFSTTVSTLLNLPIEISETTGAIGAAKASGVAIGAFKNFKEAIGENLQLKLIEPNGQKAVYSNAYKLWLQDLQLQNQ